MFKLHRSATSLPRLQGAVIEGLESRCLLSSSLGSIFSPGGQFSGFGTPSGGDFHVGQHQFVVGTVVGTNATADTITVSIPTNGTGASSTYTLASNATITADGSTVTLAAILSGAEVALQLNTSGSTTTVTSINAISQHVAGTIAGLDATADTITVTGFDGTNTTYPLSSGAKVTLDGSTSTLGSLAEGDSVQITLSALDGKTATAVDAQSSSGIGRIIGRLFGHHVSATVVGVDTTADTITVSTTNNGSTMQTTYTVDSNATITADGATVMLGSLLAGAQVKLTVSLTDSTMVTAIAASSQHVSGNVAGVDSTADTITLTHGKTTTTYPVGSGATITINGSTAALADITIGSPAQLTISAFDGKTVTSVADRTATRIPGNSHAIHATVVGVDSAADTITVSTLIRGTSSQATYTLASGATVAANGTATSLGSFLAGAEVTLTLSATSATTVTAISATSEVVTGSVSAVDTTASTITLAGHGQASSKSYPVDSTATVTLNGAASTLSAIADGSRAVLTLSAFDGTTVTAIAATTPAAIVHHRRAVGTVTGIDTTANTITISSLFAGSATPTTYTLAAGAMLTANGATAALSSLSAGANVILQLTTIGTTTTVGSIAALPQHAGGVVGAVDTTNDTITITPNNGGAAQTFPVSSSATVTLNGAATTLAGLTAGVHVQLQLSALDGKTVLSIRASGQSH
jgi:hypothetical protein